MKRYERVELQYNVHNVRSKLLSGYDSETKNQPIINNKGNNDKNS